MSSFSVAHLVKQQFPDDNILLYFTDTLWEDEDLYRFIYEASDKLELPMLTHSMGINPIQLMFKESTVFNSMIGRCSTILKMGVASKFLKKGEVPKIEKWYNEHFLKAPINPLNENFAENTTIYFGISWDEMHREGAIKRNWKPFSVEMPLIDYVVDNEEILKIYDIRRPRLYDYGFAHNNCKSRCVKAGQGHWKNVAKQFPELFKETLAQEHHMSMYVSTYHYIRASKYLPEHERIPEETQEILLVELNEAYGDYFNGLTDKPKPYVHPSVTAVPYQTDKLPIDYYFIKNFKKRRRFKRVRESKKRCIKAVGYKLIETRHTTPIKYTFMKKSSKGVTHPYAIRDLAKDIKVQNKIDDFDIGGCGCFVEYEADLNEETQCTI